MQNESPLQCLRIRAHAHLPRRAFLNRDRGEWALVTNAPVFEPSMESIPGFICMRREKLLFLLPDADYIEAFERSESTDFLCQSLTRFRGQKPDMENLKLFAEGAKLADMDNAPEAETDAYDKKLRRRAALALRGGCGGALYACAFINAQLQSQKGEKQP